MDDLGFDPTLGRPQPEIDVGGRDHRIARGQKDCLPVGGRIENRLGILLDAGAIAHLDRTVMGALKLRNRRPGESTRVELREHPVGVGNPLRATTRD